MEFYDVVDQVTALLRQRGRVSYRALKRQFQLDEDYIEDLKEELIHTQELAEERDGRMLVWVGAGTTPAQPPNPSPSQPASTQPPSTYTPQHLAAQRTRIPGSTGTRGSVGHRTISRKALRSSGLRVER